MAESNRCRDFVTGFLVCFSIGLVTCCFFLPLLHSLLERHYFLPPSVHRGERSLRIKVDSTLVMVGVSVFDLTGRPFIGLQKENFRLFEDGIEQEIKNCSTENIAKFPGVVAGMDRNYQSHYILYFVPKNKVQDGIYHSIDLRLVSSPANPALSSPLRIQWRAGYRVPFEK